MKRVMMFADIPCIVALLWAVSDWSWLVAMACKAAHLGACLSLQLRSAPAGIYHICASQPPSFDSSWLLQSQLVQGLGKTRGIPPYRCCA